jgi:hypothetical protein
LRIACATGVLVLLVVELSGHRSLPIEITQLSLIAGIVVTSVVDVMDLRRSRPDDPDPSR